MQRYWKKMVSLKQYLLDGVTEEMKAAIEAKFKKWDQAVKDNLLETGTPEQQREVYMLLDDPTIYAYAFFKDWPYSSLYPTGNC